MLNIKAGTGQTDMKILEESALKRAEEKVYTDLADIYLKNMRCKEVAYLSTDTVQDVINKVRILVIFNVLLFVMISLLRDCGFQRHNHVENRALF